MMRKLPFWPTLLVGLAAATMIALGVWQLQRAEEKDALLAQYRAARSLPPIAYPNGLVGEDLPLFRRATGYCLRIVSTRATAGRNRNGETGYVHVAECSTGAEGPGMAVEMGWSKDPAAKPDWAGGEVSGVIAPDQKMRMRLVSAEGLGGLQPSAPPAIEQIPNNHRSYAIQWFLFAAIALLIYGLALRQRNRRKAEEPKP